MKDKGSERVIVDLQTTDPDLSTAVLSGSITDPAVMDRLMQAQKMEAVGQLASGLAHDFNNLLAIISNYADFLLRDDPDRTHQTDIEQIIAAARRGRELVAQLATFAKGGLTQEGELVRLGRAVDNILGMLSRSLGCNIAIRTNLDPDAPPVRGNTGRLEQVLVNLVLNARDAMPDGGEIVISVTGPNSPIHPCESHEVGLVVRDEGVGMTPEVKSRLFEAFFTTKAAGEGTGLGLSMVMAIVTQGEGRLEVVSEPGDGTEVRICLPSAAETQP